MWKSLCEEDGRIVDFLLDRGRSDEGTDAMCVDSTKLPPAKVRTVEELLSLLQEMPPEDPPADLATKTLRRIEENAPQPPPVQPGEGTQPIAG